MHDNEFRSSVNQISGFQQAISPGLASADHWFETPHRLTNFEGERQMLKEILIDAIECWQSVSALGLLGEDYVTSLRERLYREANFWIFGDYSNPPFFSFTQVCDCLGLDPDFIRRRLLDWRHKQWKER